MNPTWMAGLAALAVLSAGCVSQAPGAAPAGTTPDTSAAQGGDAPLAATSASGPLVLYLHPDLSLSEAPPTEAGTVPLPAAFNSPFTGDYPAWVGTLPRDLAIPAEGIAVRFNVTTNAASVQANTVPVVWNVVNDGQPLPGFFLNLDVGEAHLQGQTDGPAVMHTGHVHPVEGFMTGTTQQARQGDEVRFMATVTYSHVQGAAEFQYVIGPDTLATLTLG